MNSYTNKKNAALLVFCFLASITLFAQPGTIIFKDDFGSSQTRKSSPYVPSAGNDAGLTNTFSHGSKFYKFADLTLGGGTAPTWSNPNNYPDYENLANINNGYYAVANPSIFKQGASYANESWYWFNKLLSDHTTGTSDGAVMGVNAGSVLNQFYRRAVALEKGKTYELKAFLHVANSDVKIRFEAQNIVSETILGSKAFPTSAWSFSSADNGPNGVGWIELKWTFSIPVSGNADCGNIAVSLRNQLSTNQNNDFYIDDIILTEVNSPSEGDIICGSDSFTGIATAQDDDFVWGQNTYNIIHNDVVNNTAPSFSGASKNAVISEIGTWPDGISINKTTGALEISPTAIVPTSPLKYTICNLISVCAEAFITFTNSSTSSKLLITNPMIRSKVIK